MYMYIYIFKFTPIHHTLCKNELKVHCRLTVKYENIKLRNINEYICDFG